MCHYLRIGIVRVERRGDNLQSGSTRISQRVRPTRTWRDNDGEGRGKRRGGKGEGRGKLGGEGKAKRERL